jgi:acyl carrier protein
MLPTSRRRTDVDADAIEADLQNFLRDELRLDATTLGRDAGLVSGGLIDSMDLVRIATHLERTLGVSIPDQDITLEHFDSIGRVLAYLAAALGEQASGSASD